MTQRERRLAIIVGGAIVAVFAGQGVQRFVLSPLKKLNDDIVTAQVRRAELQGELSNGTRIARFWQERTAATLATRREDVRQIFRQQINEMLEKYGLTANVRLGDGMAQQITSDGFVAMPVQVRCNGNLQTFIDFMMDFYRRPMLARVTSFTLQAERLAPRRSRDGQPAEAPTEPGLSITFNAAALALPVLPDVKDQRHGQFDQLEGRARLKNAEEAYAQLTARNVFMKWSPPPAVVVQKPPDPAPRERTRGEPPPRRPDPPPADPRRDADKFRLVATEAYLGVPYAYVRDTRNLEAPMAEYQLSADLDAGKLVLIHPKGIVVQTSDDAGDGKYFFYPIGESFKDRVELSATEHPDLAAELGLGDAQ